MVDTLAHVQLEADFPGQVESVVGILLFEEVLVDILLAVRSFPVGGTLLGLLLAALVLVDCVRGEVLRVAILM